MSVLIENFKCIFSLFILRFMLNVNYNWWRSDQRFVFFLFSLVFWENCVFPSSNGKYIESFTANRHEIRNCFNRKWCVQIRNREYYFKNFAIRTECVRNFSYDSFSHLKKKNTFFLTNWLYYCVIPAISRW